MTYHPDNDVRGEYRRNRASVADNVCSGSGKPAAMEDAFCLNTLTVTQFGTEEEEPCRAYLAAVFDGHRGGHASAHASKVFPGLLRQTLARRHRTSDAAALKTAWNLTVHSYLETGT